MTLGSTAVGFPSCKISQVLPKLVDGLTIDFSAADWYPPFLFEQGGYFWDDGLIREECRLKMIKDITVKPYG